MWLKWRVWLFSLFISSPDMLGCWTRVVVVITMLGLLAFCESRLVINDNNRRAGCVATVLQLRKWPPLFLPPPPVISVQIVFPPTPRLTRGSSSKRRSRRGLHPLRLCPATPRPQKAVAHHFAGLLHGRLYELHFHLLLRILVVTSTSLAWTKTRNSPTRGHPHSKLEASFPIRVVDLIVNLCNNHLITIWLHYHYFYFFFF